MRILSTQNTLALATTCVALWGIALGAKSTVALSLANACLLLGAQRYLAALPLARRLRRAGLTYRWRAKRHRACVDELIELEAVLSLAGGSPQRASALQVVFASDDLLLSCSLPACIALQTATTSSWPLQLRCSSAGLLMLQGMAMSIGEAVDLFRVELYFPAQLRLELWPSLPSSLSLRLPQRGVADRHADEEETEIQRQANGSGSRAVVWKAVARTGQWWVRRPLLQPPAQHICLVDVGGDDAATSCSMAAALVEQSLRRGMPTSLWLVATQPVLHTQVALGDRHATHLRRLLLASMTPVDELRTDIDYRALLDLCRRHLRYQKAIDVGSLKRGRRVEASLLRHVRLELSKNPGHDEEATLTPLASVGKDRLLRRYCARQGIRLPQRTPASSEARQAAMHGVLHRLGRAQTRPNLISIVAASPSFDDQRWQRYGLPVVRYRPPP